ncbi:MAG TPA: hypothetical protein VH440_02520 [Candidatus Limnocylindrales bacterium]
MAIDEQHVALPKLYGAPAYARPPRPAAVTERPFDPDDLPIEAVRTDEDHEIAAALPAHAFAPGGSARGATQGAGDTEPVLRPRPLSLRALAGRLRGPADQG